MHKQRTNRRCRSVATAYGYSGVTTAFHRDSRAVFSTHAERYRLACGAARQDYCRRVPPHQARETALAWLVIHRANGRYVVPFCLLPSPRTRGVSDVVVMISLESSKHAGRHLYKHTSHRCHAPAYITCFQTARIRGPAAQ